MNKLSLLALIVSMTNVLFVNGQATSSAPAQFVVGPGEVLCPTGVFLLIRKGREAGAVRFTEIHDGKELGTGRASYESYFQADGSGTFRSANVKRQTGTNNLKPLKGIG